MMNEVAGCTAVLICPQADVLCFSHLDEDSLCKLCVLIDSALRGFVGLAQLSPFHLDAIRRSLKLKTAKSLGELTIEGYEKG